MISFSYPEMLVLPPGNPERELTKNIDSISCNSKNHQCHHLIIIAWRYAYIPRFALGLVFWLSMAFIAAPSLNITI